MPLLPKDALDYLVDTVIDHFRYSACDVFGAIFDYDGTIQHHEVAFALKDLQDAAVVLANNQSTNHSVSHWILALHLVN